MEFKQWNFLYRKILKDFNFQEEFDEKSAEVLNKALGEKELFEISKLKKIISGKEVIVFGAGPSLKNAIFKHFEKINKTVKIASDGATSALLENNILPDIIVTDLDGNISDLIKANQNGSIAIIHAHGDNIKKIQKYLKKFKGNIMGTTQTNPNSYKNLYNFGGFTDGDRAVFLADQFNAKKILLAGFDFNGKIGKYSFAKNKDKTLKLKKLKWCKKLLETLGNKNIKYL